MITQYETIREHTMSRLDDSVNKYISDGWQPQGGVCLYRLDQYTHYLQTVVKQETEEKEEIIK